jgi:hypothetical protein
MSHDVQAVSVLQEALDAAKKQEEPNRIVSVASWPVSVLVRRRLGDMSGVVAELLTIIGREPNPVRRADALLLLFEAVMSDPQLRHTVLVSLLEACSASHSWKSRRILQFAALAVAKENRGVAKDIISRIPESRESRRAKRMLMRREWLGPHHFVPHYQKPLQKP